MDRDKRLLLMILDGWGHGAKQSADAIFQAKTPFVDGLYEQAPNSELVTYGPSVGLPEGQMGNSEVGHLNIGAGRVVYQELLRINNAIEDGSFYSQEVLDQLFKEAKEKGRLHLMGLVSDGGIHSHISHLKALCQMAMKRGIPEVFIHCFTDGRDTDPKSGKKFIQEIQSFTADTNIKIASVIGRYYAMDRDERWERIKSAYDLMCKGIGEASSNLVQTIEAQYEKDVTDEFLPAISGVDDAGNAIGVLQDGDPVLCFNFRTDRCRQITRVLTQEDMPDAGMNTLPLSYYTMTEYDASFKNVNIVYTKENLKNTLGEVLSSHGLTQLRIAETEKYPHVTFFFSGGQEEPFEGEERNVIPSPKVATYDLQPEMSAIELKDATVSALDALKYNFICLNFANADMVGHTGDFEAAKVAASTVDSCAKEVVTAALKNDYDVIVIADHGNSDYMINEDGSPNTAHTVNPVPIIVLTEKEPIVLSGGSLADIAPTILFLMNLERPEEMTGKVLIEDTVF